MLLIVTHLKEKPNRIVGYMENIANYTSMEFQQHFRLSFEAFEYLLGQVGPLLNSGDENKQNGRSRIDPRKQLLSVIWILATPDSYRYLFIFIKSDKKNYIVVYEVLPPELSYYYKSN